MVSPGEAERVVFLVASQHFVLDEFDYVRESERLLANPTCQNVLMDHFSVRLGDPNCWHLNPHLGYF